MPAALEGLELHNRVMPRKLLRRYLPSPASLRKSRALRPVSGWLQDPAIWHLHRRSVSGACFIGLFCMFLPIPFQMLIAAALAIVSRRNLPISVALVWISNPVTIPPMFYFAYKLGAWLLDMQIETSSIELSWPWLSANLSQIGIPLVFGSLVCGWVCGISAFVLVRVSWRLHVIQRLKDRRDARLKAKDANTPPPAEPET